MPDFRGGDEAASAVGDLAMTMPIAEGEARYAIVDPGKPEGLRLPGMDGEGWWASRNWRKKLVAWDADTGRLRWAVGRRAPGRAQPGQMYNPIMVAGKVGDAVLVADGLAVVWAWHDTGLYLGRLYNDFATDTTDDSIALHRTARHADIHRPPYRPPLLHRQRHRLPSSTASTCPRPRPSPRARLNSPPTCCPAFEPWDPDGPPPGSAPQHEVHSRRRQGRHHRRSSSTAMRGGSIRPQASNASRCTCCSTVERLAKVTAMYDADHLYLAYQVDAPHGPLNAGSELPLAPFVSGAYVDFKLAPRLGRLPRRP